MPAAKFREPLALQRPKSNRTKDALGHIDTTDAGNWDAVTTLFAEVLAVGSTEAKSKGVTSAETTHVITVRYSPAALAATNTHRLVRPNNQVLAITSLPRDPDGLQRELILEAKLGVL